MQKLRMLIEILECRVGTELPKEETIKRLKNLNKYYDEKLSIHFVSKSFYCHDQQVLAGNTRCSEPCMYCVDKTLSKK